MDTKLSALTAETAPVSTDITYIVDDPGGTPASKQVTLANLGKGITQFVVADESADETCFPLFATADTGAVAPKTDASALTYNAATGVLAATGFNGALTGNVTGNASGSSGSCTGQAATVATIAGLAPDTATTQATQPSITTCANLTTIGTVTSGGLGTGAVIAKPTMTLGSDADGDTYYRASNVLSRVAKGTAGQVYTMNVGATAPEWAAAAGGASPYDATVGAGGDYADVQAAIDASKSNLLLIANVTEDSDVTVVTRLNIHVPAGITLTMGDYDFLMSGSEYLTITGEGYTSEIDWTHTDTVPLVDGDSTDILFVSNIKLDNNSSANSPLADTIQQIKHVKYECANKSKSLAFPNVEGHSVDDLWVVGGGSSCDEVIYTAYKVLMNNLLFTGTFATNAAIIQYPSGALISNVYSAVANVKIAPDTNTILQNIRGAGALEIEVSSTGVIIDGFISTGTLDIDADDAKVSNFSVATLEVASTVNNCHLSSGSITNAVTADGDRNTYTGVELLGGATVPSGADDNGFFNCQGGSSAGGGALTITVVAGANRTRLVGNMTDAAISDSGTDSEMSSNTVY